MRELSVLLKPASSRCNIACKYCFYRDEDTLRKDHSVEQMDDEMLEILVKRLFEHTSNCVRVVFQGGEPTLMGLPFYEKFIRLARIYNRNNIQLELSIQTNGVLLDEKWCVFLKNNGFLVGLSFDGSPKVNDANRVSYQGNGISGQTLQALRLLQRFNVDYNVLMVITKQSALHAKECYNYLKSVGVQYLQTIPVLDCFDGVKKEYSLTSADLKQFLCDLFDVWYKDFLCQQEVRITFFENVIYKLMGNFFTMCSMNGYCCIETVIEADGSVYPCDFYVSDEWKLGNILENDLQSMIFSEKANMFIVESIHTEDSCSDCPYFGLCIGACHRYRHGADGSLINRYCHAYRSFFDYSFSRMKDIANKME